tara:strand:+ start:1047 stop:3872 length:2826 start_codon:yes stop_codon:yes gene_type:complete
MGFFIPILTMIAKSVITGIAISKAISWLAPKPEIPEFQQDTQAQGVLLNKQSNNANIPVIYGTRKVGGVRVFLETSGTDNQYLYGAIVLCEGEINNITSIIVNDSPVTFSASIANGTTITSNDSKFGTTIQVQPFFGADDQVASSLLTTLSSWTSDHKLSGICYIAFRITWDNDKYTGIPNIQAIVQGRKVSTFDGSSNETTGQFSTNPAFCLLDYLRNERFGKGIPLADIDIPSFFSASQVAVTQVTPFSGGSQINLFDCNAVIDTGQKLIDNTRTILKGMRGFLPYTQGKYKLIIETTGSSVLTLNEDNIIGGIQVSSSRKNEKFNRVQVNFVNPDKNFQSDTIVYDTDHSTLKTADGGFLQEGVVDLPTITNPYQALEFGEIVLKRSRDNLGLQLTANYQAMNLAIGDLVAVTHSITGFSSKVFRVMGMAINPSFEVSLSLIEHDDDWYTFSSKSEVAAVPNTSFPDPLTVQPPASITLTDELIEYSEGIVITRLNIVIGASTDNFVQYYVVEARKSTETNFKIIGQGTELNYEMLNVVDDITYDVRCRAINTLGISSSSITASRKIVGATEPPSDVKNFSVNMLGSSQMQLNWDANTDLDISFYEIRYQNVTSNAQWNKSVNWLQVPRTSGTSITTNTRSGAFCIKAVDKLGNESNNETIIFSNIAQITENFKDIQTLTEDITAGTFDSDVALTDSSGTNSIVLDTKNDFDDLTGNFDSASGDFDLGGADDNIDDEGFYTLAQTLSLSDIYDVSFIKSITIDQIEDPYDLFDDGRGVSLFDDAPAPFDGNDPTNATAQLQIATSTTSLDNATEFQPMNTSTTFKGKFFKFRLRLANTNNKTRAFVSGISIDIKMQKRTETGEDQASGTSTKTITFTNPFFAIPSIGISAQNMATGDFFSISNKSISSFDIVFKNSSGTNINRTFDFVAIGHGLKSSS